MLFLCSCVACLSRCCQTLHLRSDATDYCNYVKLELHFFNTFSTIKVYARLNSKALKLCRVNCDGSLWPKPLRKWQWQGNRKLLTFPNAPLLMGLRMSKSWMVGGPRLVLELELGLSSHLLEDSSCSHSGSSILGSLAIIYCHCLVFTWLLHHRFIS